MEFFTLPPVGMQNHASRYDSVMMASARSYYAIDGTNTRTVKITRELCLPSMAPFISKMKYSQTKGHLKTQLKVDIPKHRAL